MSTRAFTTDSPAPAAAVRWRPGIVWRLGTRRTAILGVLILAGFLVEFGLQDLSELPKVEAFQQLRGIKTGTDPDDH